MIYSLIWLADCRGGLLKVDQWLTPMEDSKISSNELTTVLEDDDGTCILIYVWNRIFFTDMYLTVKLIISKFNIIYSLFLAGRVFLADSKSRIFKYSSDKLYFMIYFDASYLHNVTAIGHHPNG